MTKNQNDRNMENILLLQMFGPMVLFYMNCSQEANYHMQDGQIKKQWII